MTIEERRITVRFWSDRTLRRYALVAGRLWPGDARVQIVRDERERRAQEKAGR